MSDKPSLAHSWDYGYATPPQTWVEGCLTRQSPIDIPTGEAKESPRTLEFHYQSAACKFHLQSPSLEVKPQKAGGWGHILVDGAEWTLMKLHAHASAEHTIDGKRYPAEIHLAHARGCSPSGPFIVVAVFVEEGEKGDWPVLDLLKKGSYEFGSHGLYLTPEGHLDPQTLLPDNKTSFWSYKGSLTTPPCPENTEFLLLKDPIARSAKQLEEFDALFPGGTNRPIQPRGDREIWDTPQA